MTRDEDGFTLIEMVISTAVLGIVMSTISIALVLYLTATGETTDRLAESPELQIASVYLTRDVQSAEFAATDTSHADAKRCAPTAWSGSHLVSFGWRDPGDTTAVVGEDRAVVVSYVVASGSNPSQKELRRYRCEQLFTAPAEVFPSTIATASDVLTLISLVDPTLPVATAVVTASSVSLSLDVCTAKTDAAECKSGVGLPFDLTVSRRT